MDDMLTCVADSSQRRAWRRQSHQGRQHSSPVAACLKSSCGASALQLGPAPASSPPAPAAHAAAPAAHDVLQSPKPRLPPVHLAHNALPAHQDLPQRAPQ